MTKFPNSNNISNEESSPTSWPFSQKSGEGYMNSTGVNRWSSEFSLVKWGE